MNEIEIISQLLTASSLEKGITVGLVGELGAGKTYLVKRTLEKISVKFSDQVISPSYNLCCVYQADNQSIHHFDLYRIESEGDLYDIDIFGSISDKNILTFIEWVDIFPFLISSCDYVVSIDIKENLEREYSFEKIVQ